MWSINNVDMSPILTINIVRYMSRTVGAVLLNESGGCQLPFNDEFVEIVYIISVSRDPIMIPDLIFVLKLALLPRF